MTDPQPEAPYRIPKWPILVDVYMCSALEISPEIAEAREKARATINAAVHKALALDATANILWLGNSYRADDDVPDTWTTVTYGVFFNQVTHDEINGYADSLARELEGKNLSMRPDDTAVPVDVEVATPERIKFIQKDLANGVEYNRKREAGEIEPVAPTQVEVSESSTTQSTAPTKPVSLKGVADGESTRHIDPRTLL